MSESDRSRTTPWPSSTSPSSRDAAEPTEPGAGTPRSLYVHTPFCTRRCAYCDFATSTYRESAADRYLEALDRERRAVVDPAARFDTIYIGGGTPTAVTDLQFELLLTSAQIHLILDDGEVTCEANPETLDDRKLELLRKYEVGRLSLGNQSFQPEVLKALGREHRPEHTLRAVEALRERGFTNFNVDLMFGAPGIDRALLQRDLEVLRRLDVPHVSAYCLSYEPGTPLTGLRDRGRIEPQPAEAELAQYRDVVEGLRELGLERYEVSNFARPGFESRHNQVYWRAEEYYGLGLGAGSYVQGIRRTNTRDLATYLGPWEEGRPPAEAEQLDAEARARELVILGLRMAEGVHEQRLQRTTGLRFLDLYSSSELDRLCSLDLLIWADGRLRLSERGFELSDSVFVELV